MSADLPAPADVLDDAARLLWALPTAVCVCEAPSGLLRMYNRRAAVLWGRKPAVGVHGERFSGAWRLYRTDGLPLPHDETAMAHVIRNGGSRSQDVVIERPDGSRVTVRVNIEAIHDSSGRLIGAVNAFQDVGSPGEPSEAAAYLAAVVASADDAIVTKSLDGVITSWNEGAERLFGYSRDEAVGQHIGLVIPADRLDEERTILSRLRAGMRIEHFETERVTKDGRRIPISLTVSPVKGADGRIIGASKVARDISDRRRFEREREALLRSEREARSQAQAASRAKDQFLAMLGHELRNPVAGIVHAVSVIEHPDAETGVTTRASRILRRQLGHLSRLLGDLLDIARTVSGRVQLEREPVDVGDLVRQVVEAEQYLFDEAGQHLAVLVPDEAIVVAGDALRLQQVVGNLLQNAWKYTPSGGAITVDVRRDETQALIRVRDTGIGISPDKLESIFDLFSQESQSLARTAGGLGIGLALVRRLVEQHNGSVQATSEGEGRGAEFLVRLPLSDAPAPRQDVTPHPTAIARRRILVVEDNDDAREMLVMVLRLSGHEVLSTSMGREAVDVAVRHLPDIVFLDIGLPDVDGYEVSRMLRQRLGEQVRVVALTGYGQPQDRERTHGLGFDEHLVKPVDPQVLNDVIARLDPRAIVNGVSS